MVYIWLGMAGRSGGRRDWHRCRSAVHDFRARQNSYGHDLRVTSLAAADALSAAAGFVMGKISRTLAAIIRGLAWQKTESNVSVRPEKDLFL